MLEGVENEFLFLSTSGQLAELMRQLLFVYLSVFAFKSSRN